MRVDHRCCTENDNDADGCDADLGPHGAWFETELLALSALVPHQEDECDRTEYPDDPGQHSTDRPPGPSTEELESSIHRCDRASAGHPPCQSAPYKKPTKSDDERRHTNIGHYCSLEPSKQCAHRDPRDECDDPDQWTPVPEDIREDLDLENRHGHADRGEHRPHGEVDVSGNDDQNHPCCHDGDNGSLHREVPEVASAEEGPTRQDVETYPDDDKCEDHAEETSVDLGLAHHRTNRPSLAVVPRVSRPARLCVSVLVVAHVPRTLLPVG